MGHVTDHQWNLACALQQLLAGLSPSLTIQGLFSIQFLYPKLISKSFHKLVLQNLFVIIQVYTWLLGENEPLDQSAHLYVQDCPSFPVHLFSSLHPRALCPVGFLTCLLYSGQLATCGNSSNEEVGH